MHGNADVCRVPVLTLTDRGLLACTILNINYSTTRWGGGGCYTSLATNVDMYGAPVQQVGECWPTLFWVSTTARCQGTSNSSSWTPITLAEKTYTRFRKRCVCVCVCVREREKESQGVTEGNRWREKQD